MALLHLKIIFILNYSSFLWIIQFLKARLLQKLMMLNEMNMALKNIYGKL